MNAFEKPVVMGLRAGQPTALALAMREAQRRKTSLRVVHAVWMPPAEARQLKGEELRAAGQSVLDEAHHFVEQAPASPLVRYVLSERPPVETLLHQSREASLLVLGTDQVHWFERLVGGEITTFVARHASCPVLVVPERAYLTPGSGEVVVAIDGDDSLDDPLRCAFEQAHLSRSKVRVLHATQRSSAAAGASSTDLAIDRSVARWKTHYPEVSTVTDVVLGDAEDVCRRASQRAEVLVLGRPRPPALALVREKPVAMRLLRQASCPVLVASPATAI